MLLQLEDSPSPTNTAPVGDKAWLIVIVGTSSVLICCLFSQVIAQSAKKSRLKLNRYYMRKQQEKDELIQYISQE